MGKLCFQKVGRATNIADVSFCLNLSVEPISSAKAKDQIYTIPPIEWVRVRTFHELFKVCIR